MNSMVPIVCLNNITKYFSIESKLLRRQISKIKVLDNISFNINSGETVGLVGESGSGKTTIAKIIVRLIKPDSGSVIIDGKPENEYNRKELALKIQMIFQDPFASLNPRLSIKSILGEAIRIQKSKENNKHISVTDEEIENLLVTVGLPKNILNNYPHQFSGGQRQRIAIARALAFKPKLIIADEPLSSLDVSIQAQILNLFLDLKNEFGLSYLFISHDLLLVSYFSDRVIVLKDGKIIEQNDGINIIKYPQNIYTKKLVDSLESI